MTLLLPVYGYEELSLNRVYNFLSILLTNQFFQHKNFKEHFAYESAVNNSGNSFVAIGDL